jgi:hypothetical protein
MPPESKKLAAKLVDVMSAVGTIEKKGRNEHFGYDFVQEEDVSDAVRKELVKRNVMFLPDVTAHERTGNLTTLTVKCFFIDGDTGEHYEFTVIGYGQDTQDKGANKALTAAVKYALLKAFLISSGEDPDKSGPQVESATTARPAAQRPPAAPAQPARPRAAPDGKAKPEPLEAVVQIQAVSSRKVGPEKKTTKYTITAVDSTKYETFSKTYADNAFAAIETGALVTVRYTVSQYGNDLEREDGLTVAADTGGEIPYSP